MYPETEFMTSAQQERAFKTFKKVIDNRDSSLIDKNLYSHLHLHCSFIAHYNIHGFRETYSGIEGFREFVEHFDLNNPKTVNWRNWWIRGDYEELNTDMARFVTAKAPTIYAELDAKKRNAELALARALLQKHGVSIEAKIPEPEVPVFEESNGQLVIGF